MLHKHSLLHSVLICKSLVQKKYINFYKNSTHTIQSKKVRNNVMHKQLTGNLTQVLANHFEMYNEGPSGSAKYQILIQGKVASVDHLAQSVI